MTDRWFSLWELAKKIAPRAARQVWRWRTVGQFAQTVADFQAAEKEARNNLLPMRPSLAELAAETRKELGRQRLMRSMEAAVKQQEIEFKIRDALRSGAYEVVGDAGDGRRVALDGGVLAACRVDLESSRIVGKVSSFSDIAIRERDSGKAAAPMADAAPLPTHAQEGPRQHEEPGRPPVPIKVQHDRERPQIEEAVSRLIDEKPDISGDALEKHPTLKEFSREEIRKAVAKVREKRPRGRPKNSP